MDRGRIVYMKRIKRTGNLPKQFLNRIFIFLALIFFLLALLYFRFAMKKMEQELCDNLRAVTERTGDYMDYRLERTQTGVEILRSILRGIIKTDSDMAGQIKEFEGIRQRISEVLDEDVISFCRIYIAEDKIYNGQLTSTYSVNSMDKLDLSGSKNEFLQSGWMDTHGQSYSTQAQNEQVISYICPVRAEHNFEELGGVLVGDVNISELQDILHTDGQEELVLVNSDGVILAAGDGRCPGEIFLTSAQMESGENDSSGYFLSDNRIYILSRLKNADWYVCTGIDRFQTFQMNRDFVITLLLMVVALSSVILGMSLSFRNVQLQLSVTRYQQEALQAQIKPHFLYNTLDAIKWMIMDQRTKDSVWMLNELSRFMRFCFNNDSNTVLFSEEVRHIQAYLGMMQKMFQGKFEVFYELEEETMECLIPKFVLQPLVENALLHGILYSEKEDRYITIRSWMEEECYHVEVEDNGNGMPQETAEHLLDMQRKEKRSYGVYNVYERLKIFGEKQFGFHVTSKEGMGTCIGMELPLKYKV